MEMDVTTWQLQVRQGHMASTTHHLSVTSAKLTKFMSKGANSPTLISAVACPGTLFEGGSPTNSVKDRENGDLGAVAP
jgi:hypothetical protein